MTIKEWPESERPRERLLEGGPESLSDSELLAIFLRTGLPGKSAVALARDLIAEFKGLRGLLEADRSTFLSVRGLGEAKYCQLQSSLEMARRHLLETLKTSSVLTSTLMVKHYVQARLRHVDREVFACIHLDSQNRLIEFEALFKGTIDAASVYPREVVKSALAHNARALILVHNHPSGKAEPSQADHRITERLRQALALVDIAVLDHLIVGEGHVFSFAERGFLT